VDSRTVGFIVVLAGIGVVVVGIAIAAGLLSWFGRLPGDLRYESDNVKVYAPLASMLLISVVLSLVFAIFSRLR
jgi:hypothetical protein